MRVMVAVLASGLASAVIHPSTSNQGDMPPAWSLDRLGDQREITLDLYRVKGAAKLAAGFAIADAGNHRIVVVSSDGIIKRVLGRRGSGPGDFEVVSSLYARGDTIAGYDAALGRVTLWRSDGELLRTVSLASSQGERRELRSFLSPTRYVVTVRKSYDQTESQIIRDSARVVVFDAVNNTSHELAMVDWRRTVYLAQGNGASAYPTPFIGETVIASVGDRIAIVELGGAEVQVFAAAGTRQAAFGLTRRSRVVDRRAVNNYRDSLIALARKYGDEGSASRLAAAFGDNFPTPLPGSVVTSTATVGDDLWIQLYAESRDTVALWVVADLVQQRTIGQLRLPRTWTVLGGTPNSALVVRRDTLGEESVVEYAVRRR